MSLVVAILLCGVAPAFASGPRPLPPEPPPPVDDGSYLDERVAREYCKGADGASPVITWRELQAFEARHPSGRVAAIRQLRAAGLQPTGREEDLQAIQMPVPVRPEAFPRALSGAVVVHLAVDADGRVSDAIVMCSDQRRLEQASLDAARAATFTPALYNGKPVAEFVSVPYVFHPSSTKKIQ